MIIALTHIAIIPRLKHCKVIDMKRIFSFYKHCFSCYYSYETDTTSEKETCVVGGARPQTPVLRLLI